MIKLGFKILSGILFQFALIHQAVKAQQLPADSKNLQSKEFYLKKRSINNNAGWECVTGGVLIGMIGAAKIFSGAVKYGYYDDKRVNTGDVIFIIGNVVALAGIPFFTAAHKYKQKAQLTVKNEILPFTPNKTYAYSIPSIGVSIAF